MRGELVIEGDAHVGRCRVERADVGELLGALTRISDVESAVGDTKRLQSRLGAGFHLMERIGVQSFRVRSPVSELVLENFMPVASGHAPARGARSHARYAHETTHRLRIANVGAPRVLGFAEAREHPRRAGSWLVSEDVRAPSLAALLDAGMLGDPHERRRMVLALGRCLARVHGAGLVHPQVDAHRLVLIDDEVVVLDAASLRRSRSKKARIHDLARLATCFRESVVGPVEHGHFLRAYLGPVPEAPLKRARLVEALRRGERRVSRDRVEG